MKTLKKRIGFPRVKLRRVLKGKDFIEEEKVENRNWGEALSEELDKIYRKPRRLGKWGILRKYLHRKEKGCGNT